MSSGKEVATVDEDYDLDARIKSPKSKWAKIQEIIWDGPRPEEEKRLVQRLDLFLM
jgi:ACS family pantothenate transporter-like MFS transporter